MGNGQQRPLMCGQECNGHARESKLFAPVVLTSGPDGSVCLLVDRHRKDTAAKRGGGAVFLELSAAETLDPAAGCASILGE